MQVVVVLSLVSLCTLSPLLRALDWMPSVLQTISTGDGGLQVINPTNIVGVVGTPPFLPSMPTAVTNPPMVVPPIFSVIVVAAAIKAMLLGKYY